MFFFWTNVFVPEKTKDDIDAKNGLLKGKRRRKTFEKYFSRIIAKLDAAAQSSELPSRKQLSLALDALLYDQRRTRLLALIWENSLKNGSPISVGNHDWKLGRTHKKMLLHVLWICFKVFDADLYNGICIS